MALFFTRRAWPSTKAELTCAPCRGDGTAFAHTLGSEITRDAEVGAAGAFDFEPLVGVGLGGGGDGGGVRDRGSHEE